MPRLPFEGEKRMTTCPECNSQVFHAEGCVICPVCGWSACIGGELKIEEAELVLEEIKR